MLLFAHTGIALGVCSAAAGLVNRKQKVNWFVALSKYADVRILMVGAMLPDIIDKPVGQYIFRSTFSNGRIFSHTLLFFLVLAAAGWLLFKTKRRVWLLTLAAGDFIHLVLDEMWRVPRTLFWPAMGWGFKQIELEGWGAGIFKAFYTAPAVYVPEIIGLVILLWYGWVVLKRKQAGALLKAGRIS